MNETRDKYLVPITPKRVRGKRPSITKKEYVRDQLHEIHDQTKENEVSAATQDITKQAMDTYPCDTSRRKCETAARETEGLALSSHSSSV